MNVVEPHENPPKRKWPPESCPHPACELGRRTLRLLETNGGEKTIDIHGEATGDVYSFENIRIQEWNSGRIDVHGYATLYGNSAEVLLISFTRGTGLITGSDDEELIKRTNETLQRHMVLDDLAGI